MCEAAPIISASLPVYAASAATPASSFKYETNKTGGITITGFTGKERDVIIPKTINGKSVTSIGDGAFRGCSGLNSIILPDSVTSIGSLAFSGCAWLKSITIPGSVTSIGEYAFRYCAMLKSITLPNSITTIKEKAFSECTGLKSITIPNSITNISNAAFCECKGLTSVTIPNSVTSIGRFAFENCTGLTSVTIPNSVTSVGDDAFSDTAWFNNMPNGVVYAGRAAYKYKGTMPKNTSVKIKTGTVSISPQAFKDCTGLESITIPKGVTSIGEEAFRACTGLKSITIPDGVTSIRSRTFSDCTALKSITIPDSVTEIVSWFSSPFYGCENLTIRGYKDSYAEEYAKKYRFPFKAIAAKIKNTSSVSSETVELGEGVTVTLGASGGTAPYKYSVLYKKSTGTKWSTLVANTTDASVIFTPKVAVTYNVKIIAKDSSGKSVSKQFDVTAITPLTNTSALAAQTVKLGDLVKVRCNAKGGTGDYEYAVYYKKSASNGEYKKVRGYDLANIVWFKPAAAVSYDIKVKAKDSSGKVVSKVLKLKVTK